MNQYIEQKDIESVPKISINSLSIILEQMENSVCRINNNDKCQGTGFFCIIRIYYNLIPVLMTNSHVLDKNDILPGKKINIHLKKKNWKL